jgi:hypothetical protein
LQRIGRHPGIGLTLGAVLLAVLAWLGCDSRPVTPSAPAMPSAATPAPTPTPTATPDANRPPSGSGCGRPYPPPISRMSVKVHFKQRDFWNIDSTPLVGHDAAYCRRIGFTDGRSLCPVRAEGAPDREACENWRVGQAGDTGRAGPTWTRIDAAGRESFCLRHWEGVDDCLHHPQNAYQLLAITRGTYKACTASGVCGSVYVDRDR